MNLNHKNFEFLIKSIFKKFKNNIIITTGGLSINQLELIKKKHFFKINNDLFISKNLEEN